MESTGGYSLLKSDLAFQILGFRALYDFGRREALASAFFNLSYVRQSGAVGWSGDPQVLVLYLWFSLIPN